MEKYFDFYLPPKKLPQAVKDRGGGSGVGMTTDKDSMASFWIASLTIYKTMNLYLCQHRFPWNTVDKYFNAFSKQK